MLEIDNSTNKIKFTTLLPAKSEYFSLFETTGWNKDLSLSEDELIKAIQNSWYIISVYTEKKLIATGRIISDGVLHALIVDLIVHPKWQGKGIGKQIMERLMTKLKDNNIKDVQLFSAEGKSGFYKKFNFVNRTNTAPGMQYIAEK